MKGPRVVYRTVAALAVLAWCSASEYAAANPPSTETAANKTADTSAGQNSPTNEDCLECHADPEDARYRVDPKDLATGPHGENGVRCVDCHVKAATVADITEHGKLGPASCDGCHETAAEVAQGAHHQRAIPDRKLPTCSTCHGVHRIAAVSDPASPVYYTRQPKTCGACHGGEVLSAFLGSVHGRALSRYESKKGTGRRPPTCSSCHGAHLIERGDIQRGTRFKLSMVKTCGGCHPKPAREYAESVHGVSLLERDHIESASCVDCHRGHEIYRPSDPRAAVYATSVAQDCSKCHANARLIRRFRLPSNVVESYEQSYHGLASKEGDTQVANCATCHRYHGIFALNDPRSSINPRNLQRTCGQCHPGASPNFIRGKVHVDITSKQHFATWLVRTSYLWLIGFLLVGMALHNGLDFWRKMARRLRRQAAEPRVERLTRTERIMHGGLALSFITLAYSGFALRYPDQWWVAPLRLVSTTELFRKWVHRSAAMVLLVFGLYHIGFLLFTRRGRDQLKRLAPRIDDFLHLLQNMLFFFGKRREPPHFGRFGYIEKVEYWALIWGTVVMAVTGFIMWFTEVSLRHMPRWVFDIFAAVHLYEAILAVGAVVVWHFYYVFINPDEAPMATTWLDGKITLEELREHHPAEYDEVMASSSEPDPHSDEKIGPS